MNQYQKVKHKSGVSTELLILCFTANRRVFFGPVMVPGDSGQPGGQKQERIVIEERIEAPHSGYQGLSHLFKVFRSFLQGWPQNVVLDLAHPLLGGRQTVGADVVPRIYDIMKKSIIFLEYNAM